MRAFQIALLGSLIGYSAPAFAAQPSPCAPYDVVLFKLTELGQRPLIEGVTNGPLGAMPVQLLVNPETGTWSLINVLSGKACLLLTGDNAHFPGKILKSPQAKS